MFAALLAHWRTPDAEALAPLLLAACDRHTHQAVKKKDSPDFAGDAAVTYYPFEILAVLRVRQFRGLKNPTLDHPLMSTPLGTLPEPTQPYTDELLASVVARARLEYPDL